MKWFVGVALVGLALAAGLTNENIHSKWFESNKEYTYQWDAQLSTGLPIAKSQQSSQRISTRVVLQLRDRMATVQLRDFSIFSANREIARPDEILSTESYEQMELNEEQTQTLSLPLRFRYTNGVVSELEFAREDLVWSENIKRAVVNMLQMNMKPVNIDNAEESNAFYRLTENTIEGTCEVSYTKVAGTERDEFVITKAVDFEKCTRRADLRYALRFGDKCKECVEPKISSEDVQETQTLMRFRVSGNEDRFLIREVELNSKYMFTPLAMESGLIATTVVNKLVLVESGDMKVKMPKIDSEHKTTLLFNQKNQIAREMWEMTGEEKYLKNSDYQKLDKVEEAKKTLEQIKKLNKETEGLEVESTHMFSRLVDILRRCTIAEIEEIHRGVEEEYRHLFIDALATAGTKVCVDHIVKLIIDGEISTIKASQTMKLLVDIRLPSEKIIDSIHHLSQDSVCRKNPVLKQSVHLTLGALINGLCGFTNDKWAVEKKDVCPRDVKDKYFTVLRNAFESAGSRYEKTLALKSIANAGLDISVHFLEKIIYDRSEEKTVRMQAMDALRQLRTLMPRKVQSILMPVYKSRSEAPEIRITAVFHIMHTLPERMTLEQIVEQVNKERNQQVAVYTYRLLDSFRKSENPCEVKLAERVEQAFNMINAKTVNAASGYVHVPLYSEEIMTGASFDLSSVFTNESILPKEMMASFDSMIGGHWKKHFLQVGLTQQNMDKWLRKAFSKLENVKSIDDVVVRGKRSLLSRPMDMLRDLVQKVNIVARRNSESHEEAHALLYIRYKNLDYAIIPVDEEKLFNLAKDFVTGGKLELSEIERVLAEGARFNTKIAAYLYNVESVMPTTFGLPLSLSHKMPTMASVEGNTRVALEPKESRDIKGLRLHIDAKPSVVATHICQMQAISPLFHSGFKLQNTVQVHLPVTSVFELNWNKKVQLNVVVKAPVSQKRIAKLITRPTTFLRHFDQEKNIYAEAKEKVVYIQRFERMHKEVESRLGNEVFGFDVQLSGNIYNNLPQIDKLSLVAAEKDLEVRVNPTEETPREYKFTMDLDLFVKEKLSEKPEFDQFYENNMHKFETEKSEHTEETETERRELVKKSSKKIRSENSIAHRLSAKVQTVGSTVEKKAEIVARVVCDEETRFCKFTTEVLRTPLSTEKRDWKLKASVQTLFPETVTSLKELIEQIHREFHLMATAEWGSDRKNTVSVKLQGEQNREMKKWMRIAKDQYESVHSYDLLQQAAQLNQYKLQADYQLSPVAKTVVEQLFSLFKLRNWINSDIELVQNHENQIFAHLTVDPETRRYVNLTVETPEQRLIIKDARLTYRMPLFNLVRASNWNKEVLDQTRAMCEVRSNEVRTFDELRYKSPLTTCYSVIAKDCSEEPSFAVLAKRNNKHGEEKKVKIITDNKVYELELTIEKKMEIRVNKVQLRESQMEEHNIEKVSERMYKINLEDVSVGFDGTNVRVELSQLMQNKQCGLCGHFDGQSDNEFRRADNEDTENIEEFHHSFIVRDAECNIEESKITNKKHFKVVERESSSEENSLFEVEKVEKLEKRSGKKMDEPELRTRVIEYAHRVCFSKQPVKECLDSEVADSEQQKVRFTCFERNTVEAVKYTKLARHEVLSLTSFPDSFIHNILVAKACETY